MLSTVLKWYTLYIQILLYVYTVNTETFDLGCAEKSTRWLEDWEGKTDFMLYLTGYGLQHYNSAKAAHALLLTWGKAVLHLHITFASHWGLPPSFFLKFTKGWQVGEEEPYLAQ